MLEETVNPGENSAKDGIWCTPDLVRTIYRELLGREPRQDEEAFRNGRLSTEVTLPTLLNSILHSDEFWSRTIAQRAPELVQAAYRGLLGREPDSRGLIAHTSTLSRNRKLAAFLNDFIQSDEFLDKTLASRAQRLVRDIYRGLLGREPDQQGHRTHAAALSRTRRLDAFLADFVNSGEYWDKIVAKRAPMILRAIHKGVFGREPDPTVLEECSQLLGTSRDLAVVMAAMVRSEASSGSDPQLCKCPDPALRYDRPCFVFLHIPKTAGTSIQHHLKDCFADQRLYREHSDNLYRFSPGELSRYDVFAGHFNYDSLRYIPRRKLSLFTFVREPRKRLVSLYHFWRAHEPEHPNFHKGMAIANEKSMEDFFEDDLIKDNFAIWNRMAWGVMGDRQWGAWQSAIGQDDNPARVNEIIEDEIRPAIIKRLDEFIHIGIAEDFDNSVRRLFTIMGNPEPDRMRKDHFLDQLIGKTPGFKGKIDRQPVTPRVSSTLESLVQLDDIIYEHALRLHSGRLPDSSETATQAETAMLGMNDPSCRNTMASIPEQYLFQFSVE